MPSRMREATERRARAGGASSGMFQSRQEAQRDPRGILELESDISLAGGDYSARWRRRRRVVRRSREAAADRVGEPSMGKYWIARIV